MCIVVWCGSVPVARTGRPDVVVVAVKLQLKVAGGACKADWKRVPSKVAALPVCQSTCQVAGQQTRLELQTMVQGLLFFGPEFRYFEAKLTDSKDD